LGEKVGFAVLWKHFNPRCDPRWSEKELRHKCHDADTLPFRKPRGWLLRDAEAWGPIAFGPLVLVPDEPRRAGGVVAVSCRVGKEGDRVDAGAVSEALTPRQRAAQWLRGKAPAVTPAEADDILGALLVRARDRLDSGVADRPPGRVVVADVMLPRW